MNFSNVNSITIPEWTVSKITCDGVVLWQSGTMPSTYQQVEWIEAASGVGAYLDLGIQFDKAAKMEIGVYTYAQNTQTFGAAENSGKLRCMMTLPYQVSGTIRTATFYGSTGSAYIERTMQLNNGYEEIEFSLKKGSIFAKSKITGYTASYTTQGEYTMTSNLLLLGQNYNGTPRYAGTRRVYYFKYYDKNDTLICDLIPCYRKSDGVIGMYDIVRKQFLTNKGSGSFTKGADV